MARASANSHLLDPCWHVLASLAISRAGSATDLISIGNCGLNHSRRSPVTLIRD